MASTRDWQRLEGGMVFVSALGFTLTLGPNFPLWVVPIALLLPDVSILAYSAGRRAGAVIYNAFHNYGFGAIVSLIGLLVGSVDVMLIGLLFFARTGLDRLLSNGLRRAKGFRYTHLGSVGTWLDEMNGPAQEEHDLYSSSLRHMTAHEQLETKAS